MQHSISWLPDSSSQSHRAHSLIEPRDLGLDELRRNEAILFDGCNRLLRLLVLARESRLCVAAANE